MDDRFLVAIPVYNEERHVAGVLDAVARQVRDILVVDDGSDDRTPELLAGRGDIGVVRHGENRGYGQSLASAFAFACRRGFDWLITMDCDGQHEPACIPEFKAVALRERPDVISGTRYPADRPVAGAQVPQDRRHINRLITRLLNQRLGLDITDAFCGFKTYRVSALRHIRTTVPGYAMPMQFWVQAARAGLRIMELPVALDLQ